MREYHHSLQNWIQDARWHRNEYLAVLFDPWDQSYFPVHFDSLDQYNEYYKNLSPESKEKVIELINVNE